MFSRFKNRLVRFIRASFIPKFSIRLKPFKWQLVDREELLKKPFGCNGAGIFAIDGGKLQLNNDEIRLIEVRRTGEGHFASQAVEPALNAATITSIFANFFPDGLARPGSRKQFYGIFKKVLNRC